MQAIATRLLVCLFTIAGSLLGAAPASAQCARPAKSSDPAEWMDVRSRRPDKNLNPQITFVQTLDATGEGDLNLDYYAITVDRTGTAKEMFSAFRKRIGELLFQKKTSTHEGFYSFRGYDSANDKTWASDSPLGALMTFVLFQRFAVEFERGSVVVSCSDDTSFVFSTVNTSADGDHPVSGNRAFGIVENRDGSVTLFTKAADRVKGSSYFDVFGKHQRSVTFIAGASIWERLLENIARAFQSQHPRNKTKHQRIVPYPKSPTPAPNTTAPPGTPLAIRDPAAFRNGIREFNDARALYDSKLTVATTGDMVRSSVATETGSSGSNSASSYSLGLLYGASYTENLNTLMQKQSAELGSPALANLVIPTNTLVGDPTMEAGTELRGVLPALPAISGLQANDPALAIRASLAGLPAQVRKAMKLSEVIANVVKSSAYADFDRAIRERLKQEASNAALAFVKDELDLDPSDVKLILSLRKYSSLKHSIRLLELETLGQIAHVAWKALVLSKNCYCVPPKCTTIELICTGTYLVHKAKTWDGNLSGLASWGAGILLDQVAPGSAEYVNSIRRYADKIRTAAEIYARVQSVRRILAAAHDAKLAVDDLGRLDLIAATNLAFDGHVAGLRAGPGPGSGPLCAVPAPGAAEPAICRLLTEGRLMERATERIATSLAVIDKELASLPKLHAIVGPLAAQARVLTGIVAEEIRPRIEAVYAAADVVRRRAALPLVQMPSVLDGFLGASGLTPDAIEQRAALFAGLQEKARELADADLTQALTPSAPSPVVAPPPPLVASEPVRPRWVSLTSLTVEIASLYASTGQTTDTIRERFKESRSPFLFFRQFPPYFYRRALVRLAGEANLKPIREVVADYRGWVVGDPHLQNFGSFIPLNVDSVRQLDVAAPNLKWPKNPAKFFDDNCESKRLGRTARVVMNDMDDGGEGSPALDLVRYLVGLELHSPGTATTHLQSLLDAYLFAVNSKPLPQSEITETLLKKSNPQVTRVPDISVGILKGPLCTLESGMTPSRKFLSDDLTRFTSKRQDALATHRPLSREEHERATQIAIAVVGSGATILDSYRYQRFQGGSGGNWRWELLISPGPRISRAGAPDVPLMPYWLELKGLALIPGSYPASAVDYASMNDESIAQAAKNRYRAMIELTQGGDDAFGAFRIVDSTEGPALARFRFSGQDMYELEDIKSEAELLALAKDQLTILGTIHAKSLTVPADPKRVPSYVSKLHRPASALALKTLVRELANDLMASYTALGS